MKIPVLILATLSLLCLSFATAAETKVVFLTGDEEYRSEESMPMLAKILEREFGFETAVGFSVNEQGFIDPNAADSLTGVEELKDADLLVLFLRYRRPGEEQFEKILDYFRSGRPIVAFRTSTHAFRFAEGAGKDEWGYQNDPKQIHSLAGGEKVRELLGQGWITHHGHFDDGKRPLTDVTIPAGEGEHPILRGVKPFQAYSWLYHVQGGGDTLAGDPEILLNGRSLKSKKEANNETDRYPLENPVAWTKAYQIEGGKEGKVFMTTLGHPYDFRLEVMRRLSIQGMLWALGREQKIPADGINVDIEGSYEPNNSGFGETYKQGRTPEEARK